MDDLKSRRQFYAEELQTISNLKTVALVDALATVEREQFLRPGPWLIRAEGDLGGPPRYTPNADPRHLYHNVAIAIDAPRHLYNGEPSLVAKGMDALGLERGDRVLHIGCGLGYYTAVLAQLVGPTGHVFAVEVDEVLAAEAKRNLSTLSWVDVHRGNGADPLKEPLDAVFVSAGLTHPPDTWLDALVPGGRMVLQLSATLPKMGPVGKGSMFLLKKINQQMFDVDRLVPLLSAYSAVGLRDDALNAALGKALMSAPFVSPKRLRRDPHEPGPGCWLHGQSSCLALE
jgi:protein-L-isoaspartate(D-aspartate) O-methyltransferase